MKKFYPFLLMVITLCLAGCGTGEAKDVVHEFHERLIKKDYVFICDELLDEDALATTSKEQWLNVFESIGASGELSDFDKQPGFKTKTDNGITRVLLKYTFMMNDTKMYERIITVDRGKGTKIRAFAINEDEAQVESLVAGF